MKKRGILKKLLARCLFLFILQLHGDCFSGAQIELHGNVRSHVFHAPGCMHYNCPNCTKVFLSRKAAIKA